MNGHLGEYIVSLVLLLLAVIVAFGKGDFLISGYNTASKEKRAKYNIHRLRLLVSSLLVIVSAGLAVAGFLNWGEPERDYLGIGILVLAVIFVVLTYTWAMRK